MWMKVAIAMVLMSGCASELDGPEDAPADPEQAPRPSAPELEVPDGGTPEIAAPGTTVPKAPATNSRLFTYVGASPERSSNLDPEPPAPEPECLSHGECRIEGACDLYFCENETCRYEALEVGDIPTCGNAACTVDEDCARDTGYEVRCIEHSCRVVD